MMLLRFIVVAGLLLAVGVYAPRRASALETSEPAALSDKTGEVPRPRPTPGPKDNVFGAWNEQKKAETPPRPRPKPGPKDGGEDD